MQDAECIAFLQWALPRLHMRWPGFRRVRRQVAKRVSRRLASLRLSDVRAYQNWLQNHPEEWTHLDALCRIPISRFRRDRAVFDYLADKVLPSLADAALARGARSLHVWSAGCAAGEEPYTLVLLWRFSLQGRFHSLELKVLATDIDREQLNRAQTARYSYGSLKDLPADWIECAFEKCGKSFCLRSEFRTVEFREQDIRRTWPDGPFDLVLCRNIVFTYFDELLQREIARALHARIVPGGALVLGSHEALPPATAGFRELKAGLRVYQREPA